MSVPSDLICAFGDPADVLVCETHGAWVFLTGDRAYKVKRPVTLPFLDYSTHEARLAACREELAVNRALAAGLYIGLRTLVPAPGGVVLGRPDDSRPVVEHAIEMRRFDAERTLEARLLAGTLTDAEIDSVGTLLAGFHRDAPCCEGGGERFAARLRGDLADVALFAHDNIRGRLPGWRRFAAAAVRRCGPELDARAARGLCRDGHGDLRAEHVILEREPLVFDRIEFDAALRRTDVGSDIAFLTMDLERLGERAAAERLVASYSAAGGDPGGPVLRAILAWQRVLVRLKVALIAGDAAAVEVLAGLLDRLAWRARVPAVLLVAGPPASGKSTLAAALAERLELPVVSSDLVRKSRAGLAPQQRAPAAVYSAASTAATYRELSARAAAALESAPGVIIDATARTRELRGELLGGLGDVVPKLLILCEAPPQELRRRALARAQTADRISDATAEVALELAESFEQPDELDPADVCRVRTDAGQAAVLTQIADRLDDRLPALQSGA